MSEKKSYDRLPGQLLYVGRSKLDKTNRISLIKEIADLFEAVEGDYIDFFISNGKVIITRETKDYDGFNFEAMEIERRIREREKTITIPMSKEDEEFFKQMEEEENERYRSAAEEFEQDMAKRKARRDKKRD